jgi:glycyl-tRNA synthetase (class II)
MSKKFMVYAKGDIEENDITIECHDEEDMNHYAKACRDQGYKEVTTSFDKVVGE